MYVKRNHNVSQEPYAAQTITTQQLHMKCNIKYNMCNVKYKLTAT